MGNSVIDENAKEEMKFGIVVNSKFLGNFKDGSNNQKENLKETFYRHDGVSVEKIVEYHPDTKMKVKVTNYDYFNDKKVKSIEEFDTETGLKVRITSFSLFKSVTEFDIKTGKKTKTTNYDIKNVSKKTSVYDFDIETEKISRVTLFRPDGVSVSKVKELDIKTGMVTRSINYKKDSTAISSVSKYDFQGDKTIKTTFYYNTPIFFTGPAMFDKKIIADSLNKKVLDDFEKKRMTKLIDNLYKNKLNFSSICIS